MMSEIYKKKVTIVYEINSCLYSLKSSEIKKEFFLKLHEFRKYFKALAIKHLHSRTYFKGPEKFMNYGRKK